MTANDMTINERLEEYEAQGWTYIPDPTTWSGGVWYNEQMGSINNGGGTFPRINEVVEALDRFTQAIAQIA